VKVRDIVGTFPCIIMTLSVRARIESVPPYLRETAMQLTIARKSRRFVAAGDANAPVMLGWFLGCRNRSYFANWQTATGAAMWKDKIFR
jgi:hypothetical protein